MFVAVDSYGIFTFVDAGAPGSMGDYAVYNNSELKARIERGEWLDYQPRCTVTL